MATPCPKFKPDRLCDGPPHGCLCLHGSKITGRQAVVFFDAFRNAIRRVTEPLHGNQPKRCRFAGTGRTHDERVTSNHCVRRGMSRSIRPARWPLVSSHVHGVRQQGIRAGNWLTKAHAEALINCPDASTRKGKRDRALLALLVGCGLRNAAVAEGLGRDRGRPRRARK